MKEHVLAIDPGVCTGFAALHGRPIAANLTAWAVDVGPFPTSGPLPPKDAQFQVVDNFCRSYPDGVVICEQFASAQRGNRYSRYTMELIGAIQGICFVHRTELIIIVNKERLRFVPKAEEILGRKHKKSHDDDDVSALAHLLTFINRQRSRES